MTPLTAPMATKYASITLMASPLCSMCENIHSFTTDTVQVKERQLPGIEPIQSSWLELPVLYYRPTAGFSLHVLRIISLFLTQIINSHKSPRV